jgi:hypothetical protein
MERRRPNPQPENARPEPKPQEATQPLQAGVEGNSLVPLPAKELSRQEKQLVYVKRYYQKHKADRLAYQSRYEKEHKRKRDRRDYMRNYREGKRRRAQPEEPQAPIQIFPPAETR